jgi:hypothetical protein
MDAGGRGTPTGDDYIGDECLGCLVQTPTYCRGGAFEIGTARYFAEASHGEAARPSGRARAEGEGEMKLDPGHGPGADDRLLQDMLNAVRNAAEIARKLN